VPPETPATTAKLPDWSANEAEAASLADPYQIASYQLRPPAEFRFIKHIPASNTWYWAGPARADETYPQLLVTIHKLPPGQENASLAQCLLDTISGIKKHRTDWNQTPAEEGLIHGLRFIRSSWSGTAAAGARAGLAGRTMHGVVYLAVHEGQAIQIMCQDVAPEHDPWLKLGAATAATFQAASADAAAP
jgi:hypothetical protein